MEAVLGLCLMLLRVSHGVETQCDGRQDGAQCYGAVGGTVALQLMDSVVGLVRYRWTFNNTKIILNGRKNTPVNLTDNRYSFTPSNGTFRMNNLRRSDGGEYTLLIFDSNGTNTEKRTLKLVVQAPVSSVRLVSECLSQGEMRVSCLSEGGDSPQYSWTLDGHTLTDAELLTGHNETNNITLKQHVSGRLACSVRNHVSDVLKQQMISTCGVETQCDGRQDGAQCYGAVGGTVALQLMDSAVGLVRYRWKFNNTKIILTRRKNTLVNLTDNRYSFTPSNGTFRMNNLRRSDGGEYTLNIFDSKGTNTEQRTLKLVVQAPVSSVRLVSERLSQGEMRVSCLSEGGDSPQYSWTLDGHTLTDAELLTGHNETNNITLKQHVSGRLACSVRNHVSSVFADEKISAFKDPALLICGMMFAVAVISVIGIFIFFHLKKKKYKQGEVATNPRAMEPSGDSFSAVELRSSSDH
ncbi:T-cell surface antigen CD2-like isoform X2 [Echeneis naucrates]|uniref:T-cell surface antigen CD2-like isoform X2 n=1 Tax=Echeneis naucrates TaxID=173247 RepID=UPI00111339C5|nr:T-cell surface antigen CD2-like isoform X2 [Echeneis naucrates]